MARFWFKIPILIFAGTYSLLFASLIILASIDSETNNNSPDRDDYGFNDHIPDISLRLLEQHLDYMQSQFQPYSQNGLDLAYFDRGTCDGLGIQAAADYVYTYAVLVKYSHLLSASTDIRSELLIDTQRALCYFANTHPSVGKVECANGSNWDQVWQSFLWSPCPGMADWLLWDRIDTLT